MKEAGSRRIKEQEGTRSLHISKAKDVWGDAPEDSAASCLSLPGYGLFERRLRTGNSDHVLGQGCISLTAGVALGEARSTLREGLGSDHLLLIHTSLP